MQVPKQVSATAGPEVKDRKGEGAVTISAKEGEHPAKEGRELREGIAAEEAAAAVEIPAAEAIAEAGHAKNSSEF